MAVFQLIHLDFFEYMMTASAQSENLTFFTNSAFSFFLFQIIVATNIRIVLSNSSKSEFSGLALFWALVECVSYFFIKHKANFYTEKKIYV